MKKTYNINLSGVVFTMDEDAYTLLNDYLDTLQHAFRKEDESQEILKDIEGRAAELLIERLGDTRSVVSLDDVEEVIARIGRPEEMITEETVIETEQPHGDNSEQVQEEIHTESVRPVPPPYYGNKPKKKLYRDPQTAMIGGVCAGIAAYLHVDVTWVRLLTVAVSLLSVSTAAFVYIVLWIILPEAKTPFERMQMSGEAPTIANIGRSVTSSFREEQGLDNQYVPDNRSDFKRFLDNLVQILAVIAKIILICIVVVAVPVVFALALGLLGCIFGLVVFSTSWGTAILNEYQGPLWAGIDDNMTAILGILCAIGFILAIGLPLLALIWVVLLKQKPMGKGWKIALGTAWGIGFLLAAITSGIIAVRENSDIIDIDEMPTIENIRIKGPVEIHTTDSGGSSRVVMIHESDTIINVTDNEYDLDSGKGIISVKSRIKGRNK